MPRNDSAFLVESESISQLSGYSLFYPCSGNDLMPAIELFGSYINEFWFADRAYFPLDQPMSLASPVIAADHPDYRLIDVQLSGPDGADWELRQIDKRNRVLWCEPGIRTEIYEVVPFNKQIVIHRRRGSAPWALRKVIQEMGIFYYRGDGFEGGSALDWFSRSWGRGGETPLRDEIINRLIDGGLIVTDGSTTGRNKEYKTFAQFAWNDNISGRDAYAESKPFTDRLGNRFRCIGYAGHRYGPTLIWLVEKGRQYE